MTVGEKISLRRKKLGLTLEDVGNAVGVSKSTVKKWESGFIANMRRDKIAALAKILQMNPSEFINSDDVYYEKGSDMKNSLSESELYKEINKIFGKKVVDLVQIFVNFNEEGQEKLLDTASDMAQLDRYKKGGEYNSLEKEA